MDQSVLSRPTSRDTLSRRLRFAKPEPFQGRLWLTEADYLLFEALDRHGPLPTGYLYEFTKHLRHDFSHLQNRLTSFYNGTTRYGRAEPYLIRPPQQFASFSARYQHLVHALSPKARLALAERGTLSRFPAHGTGPFVHRLMTSCIAASVELCATAAGIGFISREQIFSRPDCTAATAANPLAISVHGSGQSVLIPDELFGLQYPEGGYRFFALEADRGTECIRPYGRQAGSLAGKFDAYQALLASGRFKDRWGIPNLTVLTVTTGERRLGNLLGQVAKLANQQERFWFASIEGFGSDWRVPKDILQGLITGSWAMVTGERWLDRA